MNVLTSKVFWGIALTAVLGGLGSITGMLSPTEAGWVTLVISVLTGIGHSANLIKGM